MVVTIIGLYNLTLTVRELIYLVVVEQPVLLVRGLLGENSFFILEAGCMSQDLA